MSETAERVTPEDRMIIEPSPGNHGLAGLDPKTGAPGLNAGGPAPAPSPSRSELRRRAVMTGEPAPEFGASADGARESGVPGSSRPSPDGSQSRPGITPGSCPAAAAPPVEGLDGAAATTAPQSDEKGAGREQPAKYSPRHERVRERRAPGRWRQFRGRR